MDIVIVVGNTSLRIDPDLPGIEIQTLVEEAGMDLLEVCRTVGTVGAKLWDPRPHQRPNRTKGLGATQRLALGVLEETASRGGLLVEDFILDNVARAIPRGAGRDRRREKAHKALDALIARGLVLREGRCLRLADTGEDLC